MTVAIQFNNVVFPEPLAPIIPKYSPLRTSKVIPFSAFVGTPSLEYALCRSRTSKSFLYNPFLTPLFVHTFLQLKFYYTKHKYTTYI